MGSVKAKIVLLILCVIGIIVPYYFLITHIAAEGLDLGRIYQEIVSNRMAAFGWVDVIISAIVLLFMIFMISTISVTQKIFIILSTLFVGVSAGLPLFLYFLVDTGAIKLKR